MYGSETEHEAAFAAMSPSDRQFLLMWEGYLHWLLTASKHSKKTKWYIHPAPTCFHPNTLVLLEAKNRFFSRELASMSDALRRPPNDDKDANLAARDIFNKHDGARQGLVGTHSGCGQKMGQGRDLHVSNSLCRFLARLMRYSLYMCFFAAFQEQNSLVALNCRPSIDPGNIHENQEALNDVGRLSEVSSRWRATTRIPKDQ
jgi:hypothetical protein